MGSEAQRAGRALEDDLTRFHAGRQGLYVHKNNPEPGRGKKGPPDFSACLDGRAVLFDAKSTRGERWSMDLLAPHQAAALDRFAAAGGVAAIYLRLPGGDRWVPWADFRDRWRERYAAGVRHFLDASAGVPVVNMNWPRIVAEQAR